MTERRNADLFAALPFASERAMMLVQPIAVAWGRLHLSEQLAPVAHGSRGIFIVRNSRCPALA